ncbi:MAG: hypothetical protein L3K18_09425 [Thermoplasmata archaeon]|nr:hypothetical protein [Thermoplasmata archaeon]MCI4357332.1 hypothetical protein [Thermoplasmata archaeon]
MDVPLYAIALIVFALLYLALATVLSIALVITFVILYLYLALRHGKMPDNYPHGFSDALITAIFIGVTWGIFVLLGPKNPVPFLPENGSVTYQSIGILPVNEIITIGVILAIVFLFVGSFIARQLRGEGSSSGSQMTTTAQSDNKATKSGSSGP